MSHSTSKEEIVTAIAGEVIQVITSSLGPGLRPNAGSVPGEGAQSLGEGGGVEAGAEGELVEEGRAEEDRGQAACSMGWLIVCCLPTGNAVGQKLLDGDDDLALGVPFAEIPQRLGYLA